MNPTNLPDKGRMNGNWAPDGRTGYLPVPILVPKCSHAR